MEDKPSLGERNRAINGTAAYQRAMALHQMAMAVCNAASLASSVGSGASPSPDTPTRPERP